MIGFLLSHTRSALVEVFKNRVVYTIPKCLDAEGLRGYSVEVRNLPHHIEVVFTPPRVPIPPCKSRSTPDTTTPSRCM